VEQHPISTRVAGMGNSTDRTMRALGTGHQPAGVLLSREHQDEGRRWCCSVNYRSVQYLDGDSVRPIDNVQASSDYLASFSPKLDSEVEV
jgi:hypothetical protein